MLLNYAGNAWKNAPQESRTTPAGVPQRASRVGSLASRAHSRLSEGRRVVRFLGREAQWVGVPSVKQASAEKVPQGEEGRGDMIHSSGED